MWKKLNKLFKKNSNVKDDIYIRPKWLKINNEVEPILINLVDNFITFNEYSDLLTLVTFLNILDPFRIFMTTNLTHKSLVKIKKYFESIIDAKTSEEQNEMEFEIIIVYLFFFRKQAMAEKISNTIIQEYLAKFISLLYKYTILNTEEEIINFSNLLHRRINEYHELEVKLLTEKNGFIVFESMMKNIFKITKEKNMDYFLIVAGFSDLITNNILDTSLPIRKNTIYDKFTLDN